MLKNIILAISIVLNITVIAFTIWAYVMFNQGLFSYVMIAEGVNQFCTIEFEDEHDNEFTKNFCGKMTTCMEEAGRELAEEYNQEEEIIK